MGIYKVADEILMNLYRITGNPLADYFFGTFILAFLTVVIGELALSWVFKVNKSHLNNLDSRLAHFNRLSSEALRLGHEDSYRACNKEANEAFGHLFFNKFGLSAACLWPIPFALAWMQCRFQEIEFPIIFPLSFIFGTTVGYIFTFIPLYVLCRILFKHMRPWLPYFRGVQKILDQS